MGPDNQLNLGKAGQGQEKSEVDQLLEFRNIVFESGREQGQLESANKVLEMGINIAAESGDSDKALLIVNAIQRIARAIAPQRKEELPKDKKE